MTFQVAYEWLVWVMAGIGAWAPVIAAVVALWVTFAVAIRTGALFRGVGQARLASYFEYIAFHVGLVGFVLLVRVLREATGDAHALADLLIDIGLWPDVADLGTIAVTTALLFGVFTVIGGVSDRISDWAGETTSPVMIAMRPRTLIERFTWVSVVSPTAGFCEEFIFRGVLFVLLLDLSGDLVIATALSSLAFGVGHAGYGLTWTVGSTVFGAVAALSVVASGSLWPAIIAHALYDMTVFFIFEDQVPDDYDEPVTARANVFRRLVLPLR